MKSLSTLFLFLILTISACAQGQPQLTDSQKKSIQNASFKTLDGKTIKLSDYKGKVVILDFWETWCGPCLKFMPTVSKAQKNYSADFVVIAVSPGWSDELNDVKKFVAEKNYGFTHVFGKELATELNITGIPYKVFIAADGSIIKAQMGISGSAERDYQEVVEIIEKYKAK
jgi:thiol-disulfide isomerase/thioredoxin